MCKEVLSYEKETCHCTCLSAKEQPVLCTGLRFLGKELRGGWAWLWIAPRWIDTWAYFWIIFLLQWSHWWAGIKWQWCRVEWDIAGGRLSTAPLQQCLGSSLQPPEAQGGDLTVSRLCVQDDELKLHRAKTLSLTLSLLLSNIHLLSLLWGAPFPHSLNLHFFPLYPWFPPDISCFPPSFFAMEAACRDDLWAH